MLLTVIGVVRMVCSPCCKCGVDFSCEFEFRDNLMPEFLTPTMSQKIEK